MKKDPLDIFQDKEICPTCSSIHPKNLSRCPECGIFHNSEIYSDRDVEPVREKIVVKEKPADPGMYSLNPNSEIPDDVNDDLEIEDNTISWSGGSADFTFDESEEINTTKNIEFDKSLEEE